MKCGVYRVYGVKSKSLATVKPIGMIDLEVGQSVRDDVLETFNVKENVLVTVYKCNIVDKYLISTKKLPMMYMSVIYERPLQKILLMQLYFYFTITSDVKSESELINSQLEGKFSVEVMIDDNHKELDSSITSFAGFKQTVQKLKDIILSESMSDIIDNLIMIEDEKIKIMYQSSYSNLEIPKNIIKLNNK